MALEHFQTYLELYHAIQDDEGAATAKSSIAIAKSVCEYGSRDELHVAQFGEDHELTIDGGK